METLPHRLHQVEIWWWELPSFGRWLLGSLTLATVAGVLGGLLA